MQNKFLLTALLLPVLGLSQTPNFSISGKIGNLNKPARIYLDYSSDNKMYEDSADLVNGTFSFKGHIEKFASSRMTLSHDGGGKGMEIYGKSTGDILYLNFGEENMVFEAPDSLHNVKVTGSKVYDEMLAFRAATGGTVMEIHRVANQRIAKLNEEHPGGDSVIYKSIVDWVNTSVAARPPKLAKYAQTHPSSVFSLDAMAELVNMHSIQNAQGNEIFNSLDEDLRLSLAGQNIYKMLSAESKTKAGAIAPGFTQKDVNGKAVSLSDYKGKWVLVEFWASWCVPCRAEAPNLLKGYQAYHDKGFEILSVSVDSDRDKWLAAIKKDGLTWTQVSDLKGWNNEARLLYGIAGVPANFLVSPEGKVAASNLRGEKLNEKLKEIFN